MKEVFAHVEGSLRGSPRKITRCMLLEEGIEPEKVIVAEGIAVCNPKDQYIRKLGNQIARGRAHKAYDNLYSFPLGIIDGLSLEGEE